ncbi:MAG: single-stranded-DNA-specific exonuclease RecJ [Lachnospiraceae bacterium]|nr:single-stranded-DNA-specific exonuclease RecJ [Lachnospiraceae bacterium]
MKEKWFVTTKSGDYRELGARWGVSPMIARIMRNRGIDSDVDAAAFLHSEKAQLTDGIVMKDCEKLVEILAGKIKSGVKIRVIGDYDIDGVCSTYILMKGIRMAGGTVDHVIPHRVKDGYGLNDKLIRDAKDAGIDTIITCDNGIAAINEIELAVELGMTVLVTDHHQVPFYEENGEKIEKLVRAEAIVDPHRAGDETPYKEICGAVVAWKVVLDLLDTMGIPVPADNDFYEIAAFATIGDVMPLTGENRTLVKNGLKRLENTTNIGMQALIGINELTENTLSPYHVGFILGPCLNATGRLDSAENALQLLLAQDESSAHSYAVMLKEMNESRKNLTEQGVIAAMDEACSPERENDRVLVILLPDAHESIAGIVAGKVRERTGKPTFILTMGKTSEGETCAKGSGRSIDEYNMYEEMTKVSDIFIKFGGHAMAAGLSLELDRVDEFRKRLNENCTLTEDELAAKIKIDMVMPLKYATIGFAEELKLLEPCGTSNERALFAEKNVSITGGRVLGKNRNVYKCTADDGSGVKMDAVYFGDAEGLENYILDHPVISITYSPDINEFRGSRNIQIIIKNYQ